MIFLDLQCNTIWNFVHIRYSFCGMRNFMRGMRRHYLWALPACIDKFIIPVASLVTQCASLNLSQFVGAQSVIDVIEMRITLAVPERYAQEILNDAAGPLSPSTVLISWTRRMYDAKLGALQLLFLLSAVFRPVVPGGREVARREHSVVGPSHGRPARSAAPGHAPSGYHPH